MAAILLIEDDPDIRAVFRDVLEGQGITVLMASDGIEGLMALSQNPAPAHSGKRRNS